MSRFAASEKEDAEICFMFAIPERKGILTKNPREIEEKKTVILASVNLVGKRKKEVTNWAVKKKSPSLSFLRTNDRLKREIVILVHHPWTEDQLQSESGTTGEKQGFKDRTKKKIKMGFLLQLKLLLWKNLILRKRHWVRCLVNSIF